MKPKVIFGINTLIGKIVVRKDDMGCWLEVHNGEEANEQPVTFNDFERLWHEASKHKEEMTKS